MTKRLQHLDRDALTEKLSDGVRSALAELQVETVVPSTNQSLLDVNIAPGTLAACLAEAQSAGRGRRGRSWQSPPGSGVYLSVGTTYPRVPDGLAAITLAAGVTARRLLAELGVQEVMIKWPNDLVHSGKKLGGILTESASRTLLTQVVIGIGINVSSAAGLRLPEGSSQRPVGLADLCAHPPGLTTLSGALLAGLGELLLTYPATGFSAYRQAFEAADALRGSRVTLETSDHSLTGTAQGISAEGALLVEAGGQIERVVAGEVTVRGIS